MMDISLGALRGLVKPLLGGLTLALTLTAALNVAVAQTWIGAQLPNAEQTFLGNNGQPLVGGSVYSYVPNTLVPKSTWIDPFENTLNSEPVTLDSAGRAVIFGQGNYRQRVYDANNNLIWDGLTSAYGSANPSGATGTDTAPVGTVMAFSGFAVPTNWLLAYGQAVSRTTYAQLLTALTISTTTANCVSSSTTLGGFAATAQIPVGAAIEASCLPSGTTVASITNSTTIVVSQAATASTTATATVFPWGNGDASTTFNVPDLRGRTFAGADAMGGTAASRLTSTYFGSSAAAPGAAGGEQDITTTTTLVQANLPNVNFAAGGSISVPTIVTTGPTGLAGVATETFASGATGSGSSAYTSTATWPSGYLNSLHASSGGSGTAATSAAFATIQPTLTVNYIIKVAPNTSGAGGVVSINGLIGDVVVAAGFGITLTENSSTNTLTFACTVATTLVPGCVQPDGITVTVNGSGVITAVGAAQGIVVGTTSVTGGTNGYVLYDNFGVLGNLATTGSGNAVLAASPTLITPTFTFATGGNANITASSTNTGNFNSVYVNNTGTLSSSGTIAQILAGIGSSPESNYINIVAQGGATPTGTLATSASLTGGLIIQAGAGNLTLDGPLAFALGSDATGDIWYRNSSGLVMRLGIGSSGNVLTVSGGIPAWESGSTNFVNSLGNYSADNTLTITGTGSGPWTGAVTIKCTVGTSSQVGCLKPDGTIITVSSGAITVAKATNVAFGAMEGDGTTISCSSGVCSAIGGIATSIGVGTTTVTSSDGTNYILSTGTVSAGTGTLADKGGGYINGGSFGLTGNISAAAWTTSGIRYKNVAVTLTDTSSSGTVATAYTDVWGGNTIAASSAAVYTNYYGAYFVAPVAGTNVTLTNKYALGGDSANFVALSVGGFLGTFPSAAFTVASLNLTGQQLSGGNLVTPYNPSGSFTVNCSNAPDQYVTETGAFTITAPTITATSSQNCAVRIYAINSSAAITLTGFSAQTSSAAFSATPKTTATVTFTNSSANISWTANARNLGDSIYLTNSGGAVPTNFAVNTLYFVVTTGTNTIQVSATPGGSAITAGSAGTGTTTANLTPAFDLNVQQVYGPNLGILTQVQ